MKKLLLGVALLTSMSSFANELNMSNSRSIKNIISSVYAVEGEENLYSLQFTHYTKGFSLTYYPIVGPLAANIALRNAARNDSDGMQVALDEYCARSTENKNSEAVDITKDLIYYGGQGNTLRGRFEYEFSCY